MAEAAPYLEYQQRQVLFREAVLHFMGVGSQKEKQNDDADYLAAMQMREQADGIKE